MTLTLTIELHVEVVVQHGVCVEQLGQNSQRLSTRVLQREMKNNTLDLWESWGIAIPGVSY